MQIVAEMCQGFQKNKLYYHISFRKPDCEYTSTIKHVPKQLNIISKRKSLFRLIFTAKYGVFGGEHTERTQTAGDRTALGPY